MANSKQLRVGVIGCGAIAQIMHLPNLRSLPKLFEIAAICDLSPALLSYIGEQIRRAGEPPLYRLSPVADQ